MKTLIFLALVTGAMQARSAETVIDGEAAEKLYYEFEGIESLVGNTVVKVGNGVVCWQTLKPNTTDVESVKCTVDTAKINL